MNEQLRALLDGLDDVTLRGLCGRGMLATEDWSQEELTAFSTPTVTATPTWTATYTPAPTKTPLDPQWPRAWILDGYGKTHLLIAPTVTPTP